MKTTKAILFPVLHFTFYILHFTLNAQTPITITGADLPQAGQNFILANDTNANISIGVPGSSPQNWNFSSLTNHYFKAAVYDSTSTTPYAANFPASNISTYGPAEYFGALFGGAPVSAGYDGYMFWSSDSTGLKVIGWRAIEGEYAAKNIYVNPTELLIGAPATYGTNFFDSSRWDMFLGDIPASIDTIDTTYISNRIKTLNCDAWGSLSTPFGNFSDVIRIHETVVEIDSAIATTINFFPVYSMELFRDTFNNYMYMANGIGYPLCIVRADKNNNVKSVEYLIDTTCSVYTKIFGTITNNNGDTIVSGKVYLHKYIATQTQYQLIDSITTNPSGGFSFINVAFGNYMVTAQAEISICPSCIPTYFGNTYSWNNALSLYTLCIDTMIVNISLLQLFPMNGNGSCNGNIQLGSGKTAGDPVPGIEIILEQNPGGIKAHTATDQNGNFYFSNVENGTYRLWVDVPGLPMDSTYQFTISNSDSLFSNLNFNVDTSSGSGAIYVGYPLGSPEFGVRSPEFKIFPNPNNGIFTIEFNNPITQNLNNSIIIYNTFGEVVYQTTIENRKQKIININLPSGIYFWKLTEEGKEIQIGKISIIK